MYLEAVISENIQNRSHTLIPNPMVAVQVDVEIKHPSKQTFAFICNFENNPLWQSDTEECRITTRGKIGLGTQYEQRTKFFGKDVVSKLEVIEFTPNRKIKAKCIGDTFTITYTRVVEGNDQFSKIRTVVEGAPGGVFEFAPPLLEWMVNSSLKKDYEKLKALLEANADRCTVTEKYR